MRVDGSKVVAKSDRETSDLVKNGGTNVVVAANPTTLATLTVPAGGTYEVIEVRFGGDADNRVALQIAGTTVETYYYAGKSKGKDVINTPQLFRATAGQVISVVSQLATSGNHSALLIVRKV